MSQMHVICHLQLLVAPPAATAAAVMRCRLATTRDVITLLLTQAAVSPTMQLVTQCKCCAQCIHVCRLQATYCLTCNACWSGVSTTPGNPTMTDVASLPLLLFQVRKVPYRHGLPMLRQHPHRVHVQPIHQPPGDVNPDRQPDQRLLCKACVRDGCSLWCCQG
jgi:hypothetical protein